MPLFNFHLKPLPEIIRDWEAAGLDLPQYLSGWFWLSYGWYWLETPQGDMPRNHPDFNAAFGYPPDEDPHLDYQVARFLMDWQEIMPHVLEPLPEPFAGWVESGAWTDWDERMRLLQSRDDGTAWDRFHEAHAWWWRRYLDMGYLIAPPVVQAWRIEDVVTLTWNTREKWVDGHLCWVEAQGQMQLPVAEWQREWADFKERLDSAMRARLHKVEKLSVLNAEQIASLWEQHTKYFPEQVEATKTNWQDVLEAVTELEKWSGHTLPR